MKNIHVLATDKPSRLHKTTRDIFLLATEPTVKSIIYKTIPQNIYITSDEEIKEGDWCLSKLNELVLLKKNYTNFNYKKIILTTDQDLIKNGVQSILYEFLEWFIKNPSCEEVEVIIDYSKSVMNYSYKIIIPKEEQCTCKVGEPYNNLCCKVHGNIPQEEPKQETLLKEMLNEATKQTTCASERAGFILGAKWQQERSYSEEEVKEIVNHIMIQANETEFGSLKKFIGTQFEQFKKK